MTSVVTVLPFAVLYGRGERRMFSLSLAFGTWVLHPECSLRVAFWIESARMGIKVPKARDKLNYAIVKLNGLSMTEKS